MTHDAKTMVFNGIVASLISMTCLSSLTLCGPNETIYRRGHPTKFMTRSFQVTNDGKLLKNTHFLVKITLKSLVEQNLISVQWRQGSPPTVVASTNVSLTPEK